MLFWLIYDNNLQENFNKMLIIHLFSQINYNKVHLTTKLSQQVQGNA